MIGQNGFKIILRRMWFYNETTDQTNCKHETNNVTAHTFEHIRKVYWTKHCHYGVGDWCLATSYKQDKGGKYDIKL